MGLRRGQGDYLRRGRRREGGVDEGGDQGRTCWSKRRWDWMARLMPSRLAWSMKKGGAVNSGRFRELARQAGETDAVIEAMVAALTGSP